MFYASTVGGGAMAMTVIRKPETKKADQPAPVIALPRAADNPARPDRQAA